MAKRVYRIIDTRFWTDDKVVEDFSPEDKLFFLYLMTNPHSTQLGIYHINKRIMAFETGYSTEAVKVLLDRFEHNYGIIRYSEETSEVAIKNFLKYSISTGGKPVEDLLTQEIEKVKDVTLLTFVYDNLEGVEDLNATVKKILPLLNDNDKQKQKQKQKSLPKSLHDSSNDSSNDSSTKSSNDSLKEEFDELWKLYPRKEGKSNAEKAYIKARKEGIPKEEIEQGILDYLAHIKTANIEGKYILHGSTWFNQRRWTDDHSLRMKEDRNAWMMDVTFNEEDEETFGLL